MALCALGVVAAVHLLAFDDSARVPGLGALIEAKGQTLLLVAAWGATVAQTAFQCWAAWKYLKAPSRYRTPFIISSVLALGAYPVGTAIGLYSLWVVFRVPLASDRANSSQGREVA